MPVPIRLAPPPAAISSSRAMCVTCTVVSVMPYMLTSTGASAACLAYHSVMRRSSSASPPKTT